MSSHSNDIKYVNEDARIRGDVKTRLLWPSNTAAFQDRPTVRGPDLQIGSRFGLSWPLSYWDVGAKSSHIKP